MSLRHEYLYEEVSMQRTKLIKYIRINGYRLIGGIGTFLLGFPVTFHGAG